MALKIWLCLGLCILILSPASIRADGAASVSPSSVKIKTEERDGRVVVELAFNRDMAKPECFGRPTGSEELPFVADPPLPLTGVWLDARRLKVEADLAPEEYWFRVCENPATFRWKKDQRDLDGRALEESPDDLAQKFHHDCDSWHFGAGIGQVGPVIDGRAVFELRFSHNIRLAQFRDMVKPKILRTGDGGPSQFVPQWELTAVDQARQEVANEVRLIISPVKPGDQLTLDLTGLVSANNKKRFKAGLREIIIGNDFKARRGSRPAGGLEDAYPWRRYLEIDLGGPIFNETIKGRIKLDPPLDFTAAVAGPYGNKLRIFIDSPLTSQYALRVTLLPGLATVNGQLTEALGFFGDLKERPGSERLVFLNRPLYLSPSQPPFLTLSGPCKNEEVPLKMWRVDDRNIPSVLSPRPEEGVAPLNWLLKFSKARPERLIRRVTTEKSGHCLPLDLIDIAGERPGLYILSLDGDRPDKEQHWDPERTLAVSISDLGLAARIDPRGAAVWVAGLADQRPVPGARVAMYGPDGRILAKGLTGSDGLFQAGPEAGAALFVLAKKDDDLNYLLLNLPPDADSADQETSLARADDLSFSGLQNLTNNKPGRPGRDQPPPPKELRGEIPLTAFMPSKPERDYPEPGPGEVFVHLPQQNYQPGESVAVRAIIRNEEFRRPEMAAGLEWRLLDDGGRILNRQHRARALSEAAEFKLAADQAAGRCLVAVFKPGDETPLGQAEFFVRRPHNAVAPAGLAPLEMNLPSNYSRDYQPPPPTRYEPSNRGYSQAEAPNRTDWQWRVPASPTEAGWRWGTAGGLSEKGGLKIGTQISAEPLVGQTLRFQVAARLKSDPAVGQEMRVTFFHEVSSYSPTFEAAQNHLTWAEAAAFSLRTDHSGLAVAEFVPPAAGRYEVFIEDSAGAWNHRRSFAVFGSIPAEETLVERVALYFDRLHYRPGDTARLMVSPVRPGPVWLTISSGSQTRHLVINDGDRPEPIAIPVTREMWPNAWVVAMSLAPGQDGGLGRRSLGAAPLEIDPDWYTLEDETMPQDAVDFFKVRRKLQSRHFDMYDPRRIRPDH